MDLNELDTVVAAAEQEETITAFQPNGEPYRGPHGEPCTLTYVGRESKRGIATRDIIARRMQRLGKQKANDPREWQRNRVDQAAGLVTRWDGWTNGGETAEATPENVRALLGKLEHVLEQLEAGIAAHGSNAFFGPTASPTTNSQS